LSKRAKGEDVSSSWLSVKTHFSSELVRPVMHCTEMLTLCECFHKGYISVIIRLLVQLQNPIAKGVFLVLAWLLVLNI